MKIALNFAWDFLSDGLAALLSIFEDTLEVWRS
jgi:hypothetical protein